MLIKKIPGICYETAEKKRAFPAVPEATGAAECPHWQFYVVSSKNKNQDRMRGAEYILIHSFGVCRRDGEHALLKGG